MKRPFFDYTAAMETVARDAVRHLEQFCHIDLDYVGLGVTQARNGSRYGTFAKTYPLRFEGGAEVTRRGSRHYKVQKVFQDGREMKYLIVFLLPRFQDLHLEQKVTTLLHELYHISPDFDGDLRRFPGAKYAHGHSRCNFDAKVHNSVKEFLVHHWNAEKHGFLSLTFKELQQRHGDIRGRRFSIPKLIPHKADG